MKFLHFFLLISFLFFAVSCGKEEFIVSFESNGGTAIDPQSVETGGFYTLPSAPERTGYKFGGWFIDDVSFITPFTTLTPVQANITIYAKWTPDQNTVDFFADGGAPEPIAQTIDYDQKATKPTTEPIKANHTFEYWYLYSTPNTPFNFDTPITDDISLWAKWAPIPHLVTFDTGDEAISVDSQTVNQGETATAPTPSDRAGFIFEYWCLDPENPVEFDFTTPIMEPITLYAKWIAIWTVSFNADGGSPSPEAQKILKDPASKATEPATPPQKANSLFKGWFVDATSATETAFDFANTAITKDIILTAKWAEAWTVSFETGEGSKIPSQLVEKDGFATKPNPDPIREGYLFDDWYAEVGVTTSFNFLTTPIEKETTLYAKWIEAVTVSFDTKGGTPVPEAQIIAKGSRPIRPLPKNPTLEGNIFDGWYIRGSITEYSFLPGSATIEEDTVLEANWLADSFTVKFYNTTKSLSATKTLSDIKHGTRLSESDAPTPSGGTEGQIFAGWITATTAEPTALEYWNFDINTVRGDTDLYGHWVTPSADLVYTPIYQTPADSTTPIVAYSVAPLSTETGGQIIIPATHTAEGSTTAHPVTTILADAFKDCTTLMRITIPASITSIGTGAFSGCTSLAAISVSEDNLNYTDLSGSLYSKDKTILYQYALGNPALGYNVPSTVKTLSAGAFTGYTHLTSITIPKTVGTIDGSLFGAPSLAGDKTVTVYIEHYTQPSFIALPGSGLIANPPPEEWSTTWNSALYPVVWACTLTDGYLISVRKTSDTVENGTLGYAPLEWEQPISAPYREGYTFLRWNGPFLNDSTDPDFLRTVEPTTPLPSTYEAEWTPN